MCAKLGVTLIHARPHQPAGKGKQERWFRTVRMQCLATLTAADTGSLAALNRKLWAWVGSGKTCVCRQVLTALHPSLYRVVYVCHATGHVMDLYKTIAWEMSLPTVEPMRARLMQESRSLMLVGHLPFLSRLVSRLLGLDADRAVVEFQMGGVVCLELDASRTWTVRGVLPPDLLAS